MFSKSSHYISVTEHRYLIGDAEGWLATFESSNTIGGAVGKAVKKMNDKADCHIPEGRLHAIFWLVSANSKSELSTKLTEVCAVLPLPEWCATLRRLTAENNLMAQPAAAMVPRWKAGDPLIWDPLRRHLLVSAARSALQQSEGNSPSPDSTSAKLAALTSKRAARIAELDAELATKPSLAGKMWSWYGYGDPASLAAQLLQSNHPDHSHAVGAMLLSPEPLTYWQELTK